MAGGRGGDGLRQGRADSAMWEERVADQGWSGHSNRLQMMTFITVSFDIKI